MAIIENGKKFIELDRFTEFNVQYLDDVTIVASMASEYYFGDIEDGDNVNVVIEYWKDENKFTAAVQVFDEDGQYLEDDNDTLSAYVTEDQLKEVKRDLFHLANDESELTDIVNNMIGCYLPLANNDLDLNGRGLLLRGAEVQFIERQDNEPFRLLMGDGKVLKSFELEFNEATAILRKLQEVFPI